MKNTILAIIVIVLLAAGAAFWAFSKQPANTNATEIAEEQSVAEEEVTEEETGESAETEEADIIEFQDEVQPPHYVATTPLHTDTLAAVPVNVVVDFDFDLNTSSTMTLLNTKENKDYGTGSATIDANKRVLRRTMDLNAPDGLYTAQYKACWPDGSCHDGSFQFVLEREQAEIYDDLRNQQEVTVTLEDFSIVPSDIRISKGTKVTWRNDDQPGHYINSDSHPTHSYQPDLNSKLLQTGDTYSYTFTTPGYYSYHCSAHPDEMIGSIIVE